MKNLKKLAAMIMLSLLIAFTFTSCGNDDKDDEPINSASTQSKSLIGRWKQVSVEYVRKRDGEIKRQEVDYDVNLQYEFQKNGIFKQIVDDEIRKGTYYTEDNTLNILWETGKPFMYPYNITITIQSLSSSELILQVYYSDYYEDEFNELIWIETYMKVK